MATAAKSSHATLLKIGDGGGSEVFTTIAEVLDIDGPGLELATEEVTNHDSGGRREYIGTLLDSGEIEFELNYFSHSTHDSLRTDQTNKTVRNFQLVSRSPAPRPGPSPPCLPSFSRRRPLRAA